MLESSSRMPGLGFQNVTSGRATNQVHTGDNAGILCPADLGSLDRQTALLTVEEPLRMNIQRGSNIART
jgi:hypothetical protein